MNPGALFLTRLKALLREITSLAVLLLCIGVALLSGWHSRQMQAGRLTLALVNEDSGEMSERLVAMLADEKALKIVYTDAAAARRMLTQDLVQCTARIPEGFSDRIEQREYRGVAELTVSAASAYSATVSEPLVNAIMKLWFEQQMLYRTEALLSEQGLEANPKMLKELKEQMISIWHDGASITTEEIVLEEEEKQNSQTGAPVLCRYAALVPFYIILSCTWMQQPGYYGLLRRIRRSGYPLVLLFLTQGAASLLPAVAGFTITALLGGMSARLLSLLPYMLLYDLGCLGMALVMCSLCRNYSTLLLLAPTATLAAAALSGLLITLPSWATVWEIISGILPGRSFYAATTGNPSVLPLTLQAALWLIAGLICAGTSERLNRK